MLGTLAHVSAVPRWASRPTVRADFRVSARDDDCLAFTNGRERRLGFLPSDGLLGKNSSRLFLCIANVLCIATLTHYGLTCINRGKTQSRYHGLPRAGPLCKAP